MNLFITGMRQVIEWIYGMTGDYGIAIVLITALIRSLLVPFHIRQRKQQKKQQEIAEEAERVKIKYKSDKQKRNEELQKLYQEKGGVGSGCLLTLLQFPIMIGLYNGIRLTAAAGTATVLLPWVSSLLTKDRTFILPIVTVIVQSLPYLYSYIGYFKILKLQKLSPPMVLTLLLVNGMFAFMIPAGVGLYYFVSGVFSAIEQLAVNIFSARKAMRERGSEA